MFYIRENPEEAYPWHRVFWVEEQPSARPTSPSPGIYGLWHPGPWAVGPWALGCGALGSGVWGVFCSFQELLHASAELSLSSPQLFQGFCSFHILLCPCFFSPLSISGPWSFANLLHLKRENSLSVWVLFKKGEREWGLVSSTVEHMLWMQEAWAQPLALHGPSEYFYLAIVQSHSHPTP